MRLLLDTHAVLWFVMLNLRLSERTRKQIRNPDNEVLLSSVVVWEVAVKRSLGKLKAPASLFDDLAGTSARPLPISLEHAGEVEHLPWHHRDPFDRLLVAQARVEGALLVTGDAALSAYGIPILW